MATVLKPSTFSLGQKLWNALSAWTIRASGYQKLGLRREDLYVEEDPGVSEAIRRLPEQEQHLRLYRIKRAIDLSMKHAQLPKEQWTTEAEDIQYLSPYLEQARAELKEKKQWNL